MKFYRIPISVCLLLLSASVFPQVNKPLDSVEVNNTVFEKVEKEASYPGGDLAWKHYLTKNLNPMVPVENSAPLGVYTVYIQFIVDREGNITEIKPLTNLGYGMEQEVMRIIKKSGQWEPATQNGRLVKAYRKQPATFVLEDNDIQFTSKVKYVFFSGIDNELTIQVDKVKNKDLRVSISKGKITPTTDGNFIVRVTDPGERVIIRVYNARKGDKEIADASFEVKSLNEMKAGLK